MPTFCSTESPKRPEKKKLVFKVPKTLAQCADKLYEVRNARLVLAKQVEEMQAQETALRQHLIDNLPKSEASGIAGKLARATVQVKSQPRVEDWDKFYAYVKKNNAFELLQRRLSNTAVEDRWEHGKEVAGVGKFNIVSISLNKV